ncbi:MAG TPA: hypothetical protein VFX22_11155, partial [Candidatus Kapabacteria bacterium]|nr:hypothetical protein [Candidatus Kapabacteria bacterium]
MAETYDSPSFSRRGQGGLRVKPNSYPINPKNPGQKARYNLINPSQFSTALCAFNTHGNFMNLCRKSTF